MKTRATIDRARRKLRTGPAQTREEAYAVLQQAGF